MPVFRRPGLPGSVAATGQSRMTSPRLLMILLALAVAITPAPAGVQARGCGIAVASSDPELRASFERFDRAQSPTAALACALFLNNASEA